MGFLNGLKTILGGKTTTQVNQVNSPGKKILIVEDDEYLRDFYVELLSSAGYDVIKASNGELGLDLAKTQKPELILLDLMMPIMDGKTMLHKLRELPESKTLPVIILTNAGDADSMQQTKVYDNANDFLIKSNTTPEIILSKIKTLI